MGFEVSTGLLECDVSIPVLVLLDFYKEHRVFIFKGGWRHGVDWL